jgi:hypothetical protein
MKMDNLNEQISRYQIVAIDDYNDSPSRVYIPTLDGQLTELSTLILIDLDTKEVFEPQMLGSYLKFGSPVRSIDLKRDNIQEINERIEKLPVLTRINIQRHLEGKADVEDGGYLEFYNLNDYLFGTVNKRFHEIGSIGSFDFFCIVIWKANRAKSKIAGTLLKKFDDLENASRSITSVLHNMNMSDYERFAYLLEVGFRLPMLSAILTVLFPDRFLIYDYRICSNPEMEEFTKLEYQISDKHKYWELYQEYIIAVIHNTPSWMSLRHKDQYLWGKSFGLQLKRDIECNFIVEKS